MDDFQLKLLYLYNNSSLDYRYKIMQPTCQLDIAIITVFIQTVLK